MSQSAVSRQVSALEKDLKISLFHRHARGLVLTEQGEMLYHTVAEVMAKLHTAETLLSDTTTKTIRRIAHYSRDRSWNDLGNAALA